MPHLRLVEAVEKQGRPYACNVGTQVARGTTFIFCDADDVVAPGWLTAMAEALETYEAVVGAIDIDTLNQCAPERPRPFENAKAPILDFLPYAIGCNFGLSRRAFEQVGGFSEEFVKGQDVDISWRLQLQGYTIHDVPTAVVCYRYRETLGEVWKQYMRIGYFQTLTYKRFALHGMPRSSTRQALAQHRRLIRIKKIMRLLLGRVSEQEQNRWVWQTAIRLGRIHGSLRFRTLYL